MGGINRIYVRLVHQALLSRWVTLFKASMAFSNAKKWLTYQG
jgi:hypothetical protein